MTRIYTQPPPGCPHRDTLGQLLADALEADERCRLEVHVGECEHCQEALHRIAVEPEEWAILLDVMRRPPDPAIDDTSMGRTEKTTSTRLEIPGYEILDELGRGGAGVVYRARDRQLRRIVALKVLLSVDPEHAVRFRTEAEAAAHLQHPNIIEVFWSGMHEGRMYLVMELVEGGDLAARLKLAPLSVKQAATLVERVARAVHQAHQAGILHRDLKPANILLQNVAERSLPSLPSDTELIPKITDFGLAYWTEAAGGLTQTGARIGTPGYMPPEQALASSGWATARVDVYALGAVLYECLTGRPPFQADSSAAVVSLVLSSDPVPPRRLNPRLPRDLETICLKCLEKSPAARYATAMELAEDLRRLLNHEPILARAPSTWQKLVKWTRRYPAAAVFFSTSVLAVGILVAFSAWFSMALRQERAEQVRQSEDAIRNYKLAKEAVDAILELSSTEFDEAGVMTPSQQRILERARPLFVQFATTHSDDLEMLAKQAEALELLTHIEIKIDLRPETMKTADEAIALYRRLMREQPDVPAHRDGLRDCLQLKGMLGRNLSKFEDAISAYEEAIELTFAAASTTAEPTDAMFRKRADSYSGRAWCFLRLRDYPRAIEDYDRARQECELLISRAPGNAMYWQRLGKATFQSALAHLRSGNRKQGEPLLRDSLDQREQALALEPKSKGYSWSVAISLMAIARNELRKGDVASARPRLLRSFQLISDAAQQDPHNHRLRAWQGSIHSRLSELALAEEDETRAKDELRLAVDIYEELALQYPHIDEYVNAFMVTVVSMRTLHKSQNRVAEATETYERELVVRRKVVEAVGRNYATLGLQAISHAHFATALMQQEMEDDALRHSEASIGLLQEALADAGAERSGRSASISTESLAALLRACGMCWLARQRAEEPMDDLLSLAQECLRHLKARANGEEMVDDMRREPAVTGILGELDSLSRDAVQPAT